MSTTKSIKTKGPVVLCILDGWGERAERENNAVALADTPNWDRLVSDCVRTTLDASGCEVGLPDGQMGNSEVGHMNIGAGRIVMQDLPRINTAMRDGTLGDQPALIDAMKKVKAAGGVMHLLALMSPGGVHSHQKHIVALAHILNGAGVPVRLHAFLDGRDTPPASAKGYLEDLLKDISGLGHVTLATVMGRFYAMDRDKRWDRVTKAVDAIRLGKGTPASDALAAVQASYDNDITDEFVEPIVLNGFAGVQGGDGLFMANFRADRAREIMSVLADPDFADCERPAPAKLSACLGITEISEDHNRFVETVFPPEELTKVLGEVVANAGLKQLRIAETEKYAHVTFFLNGGREKVFDGENRVLIPSPKVATYDLQPEMSAAEVTDNLVEAIEGGRYDLIVVNYANGDMVGHTGVLEAAIKAAETVDGCLARLEKAVHAAEGTMLVTADHGNLECMKDPETGETYTAHTLNRVPLLLVNGPAAVTGLNTGRLADLAPTVLALMGLSQPAEMTGTCLLVGDGQAVQAAE